MKNDGKKLKNAKISGETFLAFELNSITIFQLMQHILICQENSDFTSFESFLMF